MASFIQVFLFVCLSTLCSIVSVSSFSNDDAVPVRPYKATTVDDASMKKLVSGMLLKICI